MGASKWQEQNTTVVLFSESVLYYKAGLPVEKKIIQLFITYKMWALN